MTETALRRMAEWRRHGFRIGFINGCFDLIRPGHVHLLAQTRARLGKAPFSCRVPPLVRRPGDKPSRMPINDRDHRRRRGSSVRFSPRACAKKVVLTSSLSIVSAPETNGGISPSGIFLKSCQSTDFLTGSAALATRWRRFFTWARSRRQRLMMPTR